MGYQQTNKIKKCDADIDKQCNVILLVLLTIYS